MKRGRTTMPTNRSVIAKLKRRAFDGECRDSHFRMAQRTSMLPRVDEMEIIVLIPQAKM